MKPQDWTQDESKPHLWYNDEKNIDVMTFTNDHDPNVKCIWVRMLHEGEYVSNYFPYNEDTLDMMPMAYAEKMVDEFKEANKERKES